MLDTSVSLLQRIASRGDHDDWERLLKIYRPFIDLQVRRYPRLLSQADDIAQEIGIILVRELPDFQRQRTGSFRAWLRQISVNQLRTALRIHKAQPIALGDSSNIEELLDELSDPASLAAQRWDEEHDQEVLRRVIEIVQQEANPIHWRAFKSHVLEGKATALVAKELGISQNMVHQAKSRIARRMKIEVAGLIGEL